VERLGKRVLPFHSDSNSKKDTRGMFSTPILLPARRRKPRRRVEIMKRTRRRKSALGRQRGFRTIHHSPCSHLLRVFFPFPPPAIFSPSILFIARCNIYVGASANMCFTGTYVYITAYERVSKSRETRMRICMSKQYCHFMK